MYQQKGLSSGWVHDVVKDLIWMSVFPDFSCFKDTDIVKACNIIKEDPGYWTKKVSKLAQTKAANIEMHQVQIKDNVMHPQKIVCHLCACNANTPQLHSLHLFKHHGIKSPYRIYIDGVHCPICLKMFHTRERTVNHIRYDSPKCRALIIHLGPCLTPEAANALDAAERERNRHFYAEAKARSKADIPYFRLNGPLLNVYAISNGSYKRNISDVLK